MNIGIITIFPEMFDYLNFGIIGRAIKNNLINLHYWNPRDYTKNKHRVVDDKPYGGGPGMLMKIGPLYNAILTAKQKTPSSKVIFVSPKGKLFNQQAAANLAKSKNLIFVSGRYEGIDRRVIETVIDEQWSIGDYVLTGGELAIMVILDTIIRLLPKVLGDKQSAEQDSFSTGLLDHPHYTRPKNFAGLKVPEVLLSGDHKLIERWRLKQSLGQTWLNRPDLLKQHKLSTKENILLTEFINERDEEKNE